MTRPTDKGRKRRPTPEETALWERVVRDVERLAAERRAAAADDETPPPDVPPSRQDGHRPPRRRVPAPALPPPPPAPAPLSHDHAPGLERRDRQRLRRGKVEIEARLDLHGMTQRDAETALTSFIVGARADGRRSVLVITGKGGRRADADDRGPGAGVLKRMVPVWLNGPRLREHVRGFSYAAPRHGGEGALYVLLKRRR